MAARSLPASPSLPLLRSASGAPITPLAARMAALARLDLDALTGEAPDGLIRRTDIVARIAPPRQKLPSPASPVLEGETLLPDSWAARVALSKRTVPHFYQTVECRMDATLAWLAGIGGDIELVDIVLMALARVLRAMPVANACWRNDGMVERDRVDIGLSDGRSADDPLVIAQVDRLGLGSIAAARRGGLPQSGPLAPSFVLVDLSAAGIDKASAIVDPINGGVMAIGALREIAAVEQGQVKVVRAMHCTLSCDHRLVDGAAGAEFLAAVKERLEKPVSLLL